MYFTCAFKNRPKSEAARFYAEHKLKNVIRQFADQPVGVKVSFFPEGGSEYVHLNLSSGRNFSTVLSARGAGIYEAVDALAAKLKNYLSRKRHKMKHHGSADKFARVDFERAQIMEEIQRENKEDYIDASEIISLEAARRRRAQVEHSGQYLH